LQLCKQTILYSAFTLGHCFPTTIPQNIVAGSTTDGEIIKNTLMYREKKIEIPLEISREFFPVVGSTGKVSVRYDQSLCFAFVLKGRGTSGYEKLF
jgi:hypothetical protein